MDQFSDHILIKSEGRFTTSTDLSIRQKQVITTTNIHRKAPRMSIWLWAQTGCYGVASYRAILYLNYCIL